ncbi:DUF983 domain-containing protein [Pelagimonas varians]|uniref:DUF983 domain-containing protein n=1 Tax=Pelagimonas varians TaxID=696760 RepID=A0A238KFY9_9RHOB|nr:DUF983 domain-containing protein [Pelagimonas varians]PYG32380.1 uncharacterized protein (DUF983 family) [Pelagimonas varians]SMX41547.1 hypothetical protein PEV8663_02302 [Pelagimonas varians]
MTPPSPNAPHLNGARDTRTAILRGLRGKCPNCGAGPLLSGFLRVRDHCPVCREKLRLHNVANSPSYVTILLVFLIMTPLLSFVFATFEPDPLILFTIFAVGCVGLSLYLLPRMKGAIVAFQWARRLHGFARRD